MMEKVKMRSTVVLMSSASNNNLASKLDPISRIQLSAGWMGVASRAKVPHIRFFTLTWIICKLTNGLMSKIYMNPTALHLLKILTAVGGTLIQITLVLSLPQSPHLINTLINNISFKTKTTVNTHSINEKFSIRKLISMNEIVK